MPDEFAQKMRCADMSSAAFILHVSMLFSLTVYPIFCPTTGGHVPHKLQACNTIQYAVKSESTFHHFTKVPVDYISKLLHFYCLQQLLYAIWNSNTAVSITMSVKYLVTLINPNTQNLVHLSIFWMASIRLKGSADHNLMLDTSVHFWESMRY